MKRLAFAGAVMLVAAIAAGPRAGAGQRHGAQNDTRTLFGHVFNSQTQPIPKAVVYLKDTRTLLIKSYITEADGSYHFPSLSPNVDYEVYAEFNGAHSDTKTLSAFDDRKLVDITLRIKK